MAADTMADTQFINTHSIHIHISVSTIRILRALLKDENACQPSYRLAGIF